jgi:hypothetical protein
LIFSCLFWKQTITNQKTTICIQIKTIINIQNKDLFIKKSPKEERKEDKEVIGRNTAIGEQREIVVVAIEDGGGEEDCGWWDGG